MVKAAIAVAGAAVVAVGAWAINRCARLRAHAAAMWPGGRRHVAAASTCAPLHRSARVAHTLWLCVRASCIHNPSTLACTLHAAAGGATAARGAGRPRLCECWQGALCAALKLAQS